MDQIEIANCERKKCLLQVTKTNTQESLECQTGSSENESPHIKNQIKFTDEEIVDRPRSAILRFLNVRGKLIRVFVRMRRCGTGRGGRGSPLTIQDPVNELSSLFLSIGPTKRRTKVVGRVRFLMFTCEMWESEPADRTDPKLGKRRRKQKCSRRLWVNGGFLYFRCIVSESVLPRLWSDPRGGGGRLPVLVSSFRPTHSPPPPDT